MSLRAITVSARAALAHATDEAQRARIRDRADELLAELERSVLLDGADPAVLRSVQRERHTLRE